MKSLVGTIIVVVVIALVTYLHILGAKIHAKVTNKLKE